VASSHCLFCNRNLIQNAVLFGRRFHKNVSLVSCLWNENGHVTSAQQEIIVKNLGEELRTRLPVQRKPDPTQARSCRLCLERCTSAGGCSLCRTHSPSHQRHSRDTSPPGDGPTPPIPHLVPHNVTNVHHCAYHTQLHIIIIISILPNIYMNSATFIRYSSTYTQHTDHMKSNFLHY